MEQPAIRVRVDDIFWQTRGGSWVDRLLSNRTPEEILQFQPFIHELVADCTRGAGPIGTRKAQVPWDPDLVALAAIPDETRRHGGRPISSSLVVLFPAASVEELELPVDWPDQVNAALSQAVEDHDRSELSDPPVDLSFFGGAMLELRGGGGSVRIADIPSKKKTQGHPPRSRAGQTGTSRERSRCHRLDWTRALAAASLVMVVLSPGMERRTRVVLGLGLAAAAALSHQKKR